MAEVLQSPPLTRELREAVPHGSAYNASGRLNASEGGSGEHVHSSNFIRKGYFPTELAPPFKTDQFADLLPVLLSELTALDRKWSKPILFLIPKSWPARRVLSIPNPLHQTLLSESIVQVWPDLRKILEASPISLSTPTVFPNETRAVSRLADFQEWSTERFRRFSRFTPRTAHGPYLYRRRPLATFLPTR